eukprot:2158903-Pleurochrysis_carterae.AAC.1
MERGDAARAVDAMRRLLGPSQSQNLLFCASLVALGAVGGPTCCRDVYCVHCQVSQLLRVALAKLPVRGDGMRAPRELGEYLAEVGALRPAMSEAE